MEFRLVESASDPLAVFAEWFEEAEVSELNDPNAVALATAALRGAPSVRMVLIKRVDERGFCFYTNVESQKGAELMENPRAAICFYWKSLKRQVRVEGMVFELSQEEAEDYFHSRSRRSQLGALVSRQSQPLESRAVLEQMVKERAAEFPGVIPRPEYWRGFVLRPEWIEFWQDGADRLHDRVVFTRSGEGWEKQRLFP